MRSIAVGLLSVVMVGSAARAIEIAQADVKIGSEQPIMLRDDGTVWSWGAPAAEQLRSAGPWAARALVPLEHIVTIGAGAAVDRSGHVWTWPLGDPKVVDGIDGAIAVDGGSYYTIALQRGGSVWSWRNDYDRNGRVAPPAPPAHIQGLEDVVAIDAGHMFALAVTHQGDVWSWDENAVGEHGGYTAHRTPPIRVDGLKNIVAVAAGDDHALALGRDGHVWAWGKNTRGQLGDGTGADRAQPVLVDSLADIHAIAAGTSYSLALRKDGTVWAWGTGQLGDGIEHRRPVAVKDLSAVIAIAAGGKLAIAICEDGSVWTWGTNERGQLGYASSYSGGRSTLFSSVPKRIPRLNWQHEMPTDTRQPSAPLVRSGVPPAAPPPAAAASGGANEQLQYALDDFRSSEPAVRARGATRLGKLGAGARVALPELERAIQSDEAAVRSAARCTYLELTRGEPAAVPVAVAALADLGARVCATAALTNIGAPAVPLLLKLIPQADGATRVAAADLLGKADLTHQDPALIDAAVNAVLPSLDDPDRTVRINAARTLVPFGAAARQGAPLLAQWVTTSKDTGMRVAATMTLGAMGPGVPEVMPALEKALRDQYDVSVRAQTALKRIDTPEAKAMLAAWQRWVVGGDKPS